MSNKKDALDKVKESLEMVALQAAETEKRSARFVTQHNKEIAEIRKIQAENARQLGRKRAADKAG